jgi:hypothetical protein
MLYKPCPLRCAAGCFAAVHRYKEYLSGAVNIPKDILDGIARDLNNG